MPKGWYRQLAKHISLWLNEALPARPVFVTLRSDGNTQVTIHRVGRLGAFSERRLRLPPGSYSAVGNRRGYRDVRVVFRVPGTDGHSAIVVRCEEPI